MKSIGAEISKSIKEQSWIHLEYENKKGETTYFWAAIKDVYPKTKKLLVDMFNSKYYESNKNSILETTLSFDQIKNATILEETTYETPDQLYKTIDEHIHHLEWLAYDQFDHKILSYLKRAFDMDNAPYQLEGDFIDGIDERKLLNEKEIKLKGIQIDQITERILKQKNHKSKSETAYTVKSLALNDLSIVTPQGTFVIAYYPLKFNPKGMTLSISNDVVINQVFLTEGFPRNLKNYLNIDPDHFMKNYQVHKEIYRAYIKENLKQNESLNEQPFMMEIARDITINLRHDYDAIVNLHKNQKMNTPLIAFFGNMNQKMKKRTERSVVVLDKRVNIDQLRVIHNALKQYITYVQGPPGTGKTQTILNVLISAFFNEDTVLVSSSNNHPLDGIMEKMKDLKYKGMRIPFPILRLGNKDYMIEALKTIKTQFETCKPLTVYEDALKMNHEKKSENVEDLNKLLDQYEERLELEEKLEVLKTFQDSAGSFHSSIIVSDEIEKLKKKLDALPKVSNEEALEKVEVTDRRFSTWLNFMSVERIQRLGEKKYENLWKIINMDDEEAQYKAFKEYLRDKKNFKDFQRVFPFIVSTLHSVPKLGPSESNFDLAVIDEASQSNIAISLPALLRGDRLLLVGDPNQLAPVVTIDPGINEALRRNHRIRNTYDFRSNSIMKTMQTVDPISKFVLLRYHYRSQKPIIAFSNKKYYGEALIIKTKDLNNKALKFYDVKNDEEDATYHVAKEEAEIIKGIVKKYSEKSVGVITPFRKQKDAITETLGRKTKDSVDIGTIHSFQGDEKDIIIISPAIKKSTKKKTFDWIKNNRELLNVGTTRAKEELIVVADYKAIKDKSGKDQNDLFDLCQYVKKQNYRRISPNSDSSTRRLGDGLKLLNSNFENEFLKTMTHLFTVYNGFIIKEKIGLKSVFDFKKIDQPELVDYMFKGEFDFVVYDSQTKRPLLAIELDGAEHLSDEEVQERDKKKEAICSKYGFDLLRIPNDYARRYQSIREIMLKMLKA